VLPLSGLFSFSKTSAVKIAVFSEKAEPEGVNEYYENKVAVVTGGASGIGLALSELILSSGGRAVVIADLNAEKLVTEVDRLKATHPGKVLGCHTDITEQESVAAMIRSAAEFGAGHIHFLFNNAGLGLTKSFDETSDTDWKFAFDVNFFGPLYGIRAVLPIMRAQGGGHIANTASGIGFAPMAYQSMYSATKSALIGAPDSAISAEQAARGILRGVAANERIVIVTEADRRGAINAFHPDRAEAVDDYLLSVARKRKRGETAV
jgi:NAD(P)-dependent dehydrogenase (short-subunit alcohol dehydrogenase family)